MTLNKNIRNKIKDKRYIKYNSKALLQILSIDPIAGRIYKYISKIRYEKQEDVVNLRTLAAIIPLKTEQVTERINKNGESRTYTLSRLKQVLKRIEKAFEVLSKLKYIEHYQSKRNEEEDTYYINYRFNKERDGDCHVSSYLKPTDKKIAYLGKWDKVNKKKKDAKIKKDLEILEAEIIPNTEERMGKITPLKDLIIPELTMKRDRKESEEERLKVFSSFIKGRMNKAKKNIYISRTWNKRVENKIAKIIKEESEELALEVLAINL